MGYKYRWLGSGRRGHQPGGLGADAARMAWRGVRRSVSLWRALLGALARSVRAGGYNMGDDRPYLGVRLPDAGSRTAWRAEAGQARDRVAREAPR